MKYKKIIYPVQKTPTGAQHNVVAYTFIGKLPGPKIYIQANLHGPEVFGTALLVELIQKLEHKHDISGEIVIVPCANPMSVTAVTHNAYVGRWNQIDGVNWNRIFPKDVYWKDYDEEKKYFVKLSKKENLSVQEKLASTLRLLSSGSDFVIDIHATGTETCSHVFCREDMSDIFAPLGAEIHLLSKKNVSEETFEESHVYPFRDTLDSLSIPKACTWEVSGYGVIRHNLIKQRLQQLENWLSVIWGERNNNIIIKHKIYTFFNLKSPIAGYYSFVKRIGDNVKKGEIYAHVYLPYNAEIQHIKAEYDFTLIATYGIGAIGEGEQIAWVGF